MFISLANSHALFIVDHFFAIAFPFPLALALLRACAFLSCTPKARSPVRRSQKLAFPPLPLLLARRTATRSSPAVETGLSCFVGANHPFPAILKTAWKELRWAEGRAFVSRL